MRCVHVVSTKQHACTTTSIYPLQETLTKKQVPVSRKFPGSVKNTPLFGWVIQPSESAWSFSFTTQTHTVWLPAQSTLHTTLLTIFSTWIIEQFLCHCSAMSSNRASKNLQSHFHDRYVPYSLPNFLHLSEQHCIIHLGVVCLKKKRRLYSTLNK